jgi:hypothetical protein
MSTNVTNALLNVKANKINQVNDSLGSLFTKDDVKNIIEKLFNDIDDVLIEQTSETETNTLSKEVVLKIVSDSIDDMDSDYYKQCAELDNLEFSIGYSNQVELDSYDLEFDVTRLKRELLSIVSEQYENNVVVSETNANA